uniref:Uncharacterized protein n=1 Tax=Anguilla anguilla TaxID=7936 RepID=A0A0E9SNE1_ANGAN
MLLNAAAYPREVFVGSSRGHRAVLGRP